MNAVDARYIATAAISAKAIGVYADAIGKAASEGGFTCRFGRLTPDEIKAFKTCGYTVEEGAGGTLVSWK